MRKEIIILIIITILMTGCAKIQEDFKPAEKNISKDKDLLTMCSAELMVCPDDSYVGRDPNDDCNFKKCPTDGYGDTSDGWGATN